MTRFFETIDTMDPVAFTSAVVAAAAIFALLWGWLRRREIRAEQAAWRKQVAEREARQPTFPFGRAVPSTERATTVLPLRPPTGGDLGLLGFPRTQAEVMAACRQGCQWCHICTDFYCGDNMHPDRPTRAYFDYGVSPLEQARREVSLVNALRAHAAAHDVAPNDVAPIAFPNAEPAPAPGDEVSTGVITTTTIDARVIAEPMVIEPVAVDPTASFDPSPDTSTPTGAPVEEAQVRELFPKRDEEGVT